MKLNLGLVFFCFVLCSVLMIGCVLNTHVADGTNVSFRTSDGRWTDKEKLSKGYDFKDVVVNYELYKIICNAPKAKLLRVTRRSNRSLSNMFDDRSDPKWRVPAVPNKPVSFKAFYTVDGKRAGSCFEKGGSPEQVALAKTRASRYIDLQ